MIQCQTCGSIFMIGTQDEQEASYEAHKPYCEAKVKAKKPRGKKAKIPPPVEDGNGGATLFKHTEEW